MIGNQIKQAQTQAIQTQPIKITVDIPNIPNFDGKDPVGIIIALTVFARILTHKPKNPK